MQPRKPAFRVSCLTALFALSLSPCMAEGPPAADNTTKTVVLTAWLQVADHSYDLATVSIEVNGDVCYPGISRSGRVQLKLPANTQATLRFEHPGHLPKVVVVDTHHAQDGSFGERTRYIQFAVVLEEERHMAGFTYAGPLGNIGFEQGGGCLAVAHTYKLTQARRNTAVQF
ncbi:MAG: hypothetical protein JNM31_06525 [Flavobacteriales bacterium]|nr:hypothetical protein [Flavobacteriales bacterium]